MPYLMLVVYVLVALQSLVIVFFAGLAIFYSLKLAKSLWALNPKARFFFWVVAVLVAAYCCKQFWLVYVIVAIFVWIATLFIVGVPVVYLVVFSIIGVLELCHGAIGLMQNKPWIVCPGCGRRVCPKCGRLNPVH